MMSSHEASRTRRAEEIANYAKFAAGGLFWTFVCYGWTLLDGMLVEAMKGQYPSDEWVWSFTLEKAVVLWVTLAALGLQRSVLIERRHAAARDG